MSLKPLKKHITRLMVLLLTILLFMPCVPVAQAESGSCGSSLSWSFDGSTLKISGSGAMTDYGANNFPPWYSFRSQIYTLSLPEGLTRVGDMAFYECTNIGSVTLPGSVTDIGELAFCLNSGMTMLTMNNGLRTIGRSAFERCSSLKDLRIPGTVTTIGKNAFYVCKSLTYVTIPASVTSMGIGVFAYCDNLARVDVEAAVDEIPFFTFYGCDSLSSVTFNGKAEDVEILKTEQGSTGTPTQTTNPDANGNTAGSMNVVQQDDGQIQINENTTTKTDNTTITKTDSVTTGSSDGTYSTATDITASVLNPDGWSEVVDQIQSVQDEEADNEETEIGVTVYVPNDDTVPKDVLQQIAGTNTTLTVQSQSGSVFKIQGSVLDKKGVTQDLDLSYTIELLDAVPDGIETQRAYRLVFNKSCPVKVEAMIRLPLENVRYAASLYQLGKKDTYEFLQSVVVDNDGYAHYYLGSIDKNTQYLIAMNVQGEQSSQAIIPENLYDEYTLVDHSTGKQYVITGRKSSWNMGLGKVMAILAVVMVSAIGVIGFVMYFWNKQRLKAGYVPQWDDEDETT